MPTRQDCPFTSYRFTAEELAMARNLGTEQRAYYQTLMADAATEKIALTFDPEKPKSFLQGEAYLRGQIDILNMLLSDEGKMTRPKLTEAADSAREPGKPVEEVVLPTSREPKPR